MFGPALAALTAATCMATPVQTFEHEPYADSDVVRAGPFVGFVSRGYDAVQGRFSLRVGGMRTSSLSSKIPWFLPDGYGDVDTLVVTGRRLSRPTARFTQRFALAGGTTTPSPDLTYVFPSTINPPKTGCWELTFRAGTASGTLYMLARQRARG
jgi:hypothetical protein